MSSRDRKGIILAGGSGTRLYPVTQAISKQMVPIYDKPLIYYPISILMLANVREIAIISTPIHLNLYKEFLGDGSRFGLRFEYIMQSSPDGLAQAYTLSEKFLAGSPSCLALGDNIFFGHSLTDMLIEASNDFSKSTIFCSQVINPERYGVIEFDNNSKIISIEEKPDLPKSNFAVTGLYFLDGNAPLISKEITPSDRGELEIVSVLKYYLDKDLLYAKLMKRGFAWFDTGTHSSMLQASNFVQMIQEKQGLMVACLEEIAFNKSWIDEEAVLKSAQLYSKSNYGKYLYKMLN